MRSGLALAWIAAATACVALGCGESRLGSAEASRSAGMGPALRAALAEGSRLERFRALTETLDGLEPDNLAEAVAVYDGELSGLGDCEIGIFVDAWTRFDPLSAVGLPRFQLPRTSSNIIWSIPAAWDSSGQRIAKYQETPNLAPLLAEVLAHKIEFRVGDEHEVSR